MYYERFEELCNLKGVKPSTVSKATGVPTSTLTNWKQGNYTPKQGNLQKIADYFNVSLDYIMEREKAKTDYSDELVGLLGKVRKDAELVYALKKYFSLSEEKKKHIISTINMISED